ncbi:hypothetical protein BGZ96_011617 [Linnemannia gamsii]|uniref:Uncharacterized protein n=1 Tax=Linnemannia gamsii TaxID=64522 RepID=A0ABQ7JRX5_9FUNG|nr:hypothetical protein BGZ96_011617 [Linnemannia gamsii]
MSQTEQNVVGSIDPYTLTSSSQVNAESTPLGVASDNLDQTNHHAPLEPSSTPNTTATATPVATATATPVATATTAAAPGRKPSLTDTLIAGATTAATTATKAANNAVETARRLVGNDGSSEINLDNEIPDTVQVEETSSSKGGILNLMRNNNGTKTTATSTDAGAPINSGLHRSNSIVGQTAVLNEQHEPYNTLYVVQQGGARSQALGVDKRSVSSTNKTMKSQTQSGLSVDKPVYVGDIEDPKTQARRRGSLHVDKMPVFSQDALNNPKDQEQNSYTRDVMEANSVDGNEKPAPLQSSLSRRRQSSFSSMNVDAPTVATSKIAGSGSTDNTNRNRPVGTYNTGINVDRPGHHHQKSSGFGVDKPAIVTHQLATATKMQDPSPTVPGRNTKTTITNNTNQSPPLNNLRNPQNSTLNPYSTTTTSETVINPAEMGPTVTYQNTSNFSTSAPVDPLVIPADYNGPIPQVNSGEHVIWVKKTVQTDYYDGAHDNTSGLVPPAPTQDSGTQKRRSSAGSLLDRILGRRTSAVSIDKGKQRT